MVSLLIFFGFGIDFCTISVPCGIKTALFLSKMLTHFLSSTSTNESTRISSSIKSNLLYNFSRFFSHTSRVLRPSSFAPLSTCNAQCEPKVAIDAILIFVDMLGFMKVQPVLGTHMQKSRLLGQLKDLFSD